MRRSPMTLCIREICFAGQSRAGWPLLVPHHHRVRGITGGYFNNRSKSVDCAILSASRSHAAASLGLACDCGAAGQGWGVMGYST